MNVGSRWGVKLQNPSGVTPIDPVTVPDVARVMLYQHNAPYGPQKSLIISGDPAANGDSVWMCADEQLVANPLLIGLRDQASNGGEQPTMQSFGLQYSTDGAQDLTIGNTPVQTGLNDWTGYFWGYYDSGALCVALGNNSTSAAVFVDDTGVFNVFDDAAADLGGISGVSTGFVLCRINYNSTTGAYSLAATGAGSTSTTTSTGKVHSFNYVGQAPGLDPSVINGSVANRYGGSIIVARSILLGSAEDLGIIATINTYPGGPYTL